MKLFNKIFKTKTSKTGLSDGWIETKISEDTYVPEIPQEQKNNWDKERRENDKIGKLCKIDGFHNKPNGRVGTIYYVEKGKVCELYYEISGVKEFDILISFEQLKEWTLPKINVISKNDKYKIKKELLTWLVANKIRAEL